MARPDRGEFDRALVALEEPLFHFALSLAGNPQDAADLLQDTFVKILRSRGQFEEGTNLRAWASKIMRNAFIDRRRRRRYEPVPVDEVGTAEPARPASSAAGRPAGIVEDVREALGRLDPDHRAVLVLCDIQGYRYREIADILGVPIGTCMSRIHRARRKLKELLGPQATSASERRPPAD